MKTIDIVKKARPAIVVFLAGFFLALVWQVGVWPTSIGVMVTILIVTFTRHMKKEEKKFFFGLALNGFLVPALALASFVYIAVQLT